MIEVFKIVSDFVDRPVLEEIFEQVKDRCPEMNLGTCEAFKEAFPSSSLLISTTAAKQEEK